MRKETFEILKSLKWTWIGLAIMFATIPLGTMAIMNFKHPFSSLLTAGAITVGAFLEYWGFFRDDNQTIRTNSKKSSDQTDLMEFIDPWKVKIPKVKKLKEKDKIPSIWDNRVLARR